jgi:hypothetical protein
MAMTNQVAKRETESVTLTPMDMIDRAVASGANVETLTKLMDLQERWEKNQARKAFDAAIADAKAKIKPVHRNVTGHNSKKYADFANIARAVDPILSEHGLSYRDLRSIAQLRPQRRNHAFRPAGQDRK